MKLRKVAKEKFSSSRPVYDKNWILRNMKRKRNRFHQITYIHIALFSSLSSHTHTDNTRGFSLLFHRGTWKTRFSSTQCNARIFLRKKKFRGENNNKNVNSLEKVRESSEILHWNFFSTYIVGEKLSLVYTM